MSLLLHRIALTQYALMVTLRQEVLSNERIWSDVYMNIDSSSVADLQESVAVTKCSRIFNSSWVLAPELINSSSVVAWLRNERISSARYWSALEEGQNKVVMYAKTSPYPSATPYDRMIRFEFCDAYLKDKFKNDCVHESKALTQIDDVNIARNTAVIRYGKNIYFLGGEHSGRCGKNIASDPCGKGASVWRLNSNQKYDRRIPNVIDGYHDGCIEKRKKLSKLCEYDGRWSLALLSLSHQQQPQRQRIFVYGRANLHPEMGGRWIVAASIDATEFAQAVDKNMKPIFQTFRKLQFAEYDQLFWAALSSRARSKYSLHILNLINEYARNESTEINMYFFSVNANPIDNGTSLLAVYPMNIGYISSDVPKSAFIALSLSCDGFHFSAPYPILNSIKATVGPRGLDHPVDGFVRKKSQLFPENSDLDNFILYEHINVRGISHHHDKKGQSGGLRDYPPHLVAHTISHTALAAFTFKAKAHLRRAHNKHATRRYAAAAAACFHRHS